MVFSSITFLFFFLPLFLLIYHVLKPSLQFVFLLASSLFFYFWGENMLIWVLFLTSFIDYFCGLVIANGLTKSGPLKLEPGSKRSRLQKGALLFSIISNLSLLGYFKYANFFVENTKLFLASLGLSSTGLDSFSEIVLPLGISFYTFQSMSYTIDVYLGNVKANRNLIQYGSFVTMFPQLVAGPIVRYRDIEAEMNNHKVDLDGFVYGIKRFIIGLAKKVIIANSMAVVADKIFALPFNELSTGVAWLGIIAYSLQIFFDFSGYSCMAIGMGKMIGFNFPENFNYPYISQSIQEFWRRWHITLSTWFRDYLYIPLGGSKKGNLITIRNLVIVFFLCGLWHGAEWNFIIWGLFQGFFLVLERTKFKNLLNNTPTVLRILYMNLVIMLGWVLFRSENLADAMHYFSVLFGGGVAKTQLSIVGQLFTAETTIIFIVGIILSTPIFVWLQKNIKKHFKNNNIIDILYLIVLIALFMLCAMKLASGTYNPFIYFRF
jgi:alginate O-acetyltransferase complex protein AlgI